MIKNPFLIIGVLLAIEIFILYISAQPRFKKYFKFIPSVFWIYFLPMLASTCGILDSQSAIYQIITTNLLPASLLLLLIAVDIKAIMKLGKAALLMFFAGSLGMMLGMPLVFFLFKKIVGEEFWPGFGALSASWTGGSANMIAVKEALNVPDNIFLPMVVVDTVVPYVWMGILVGLVGFQAIFDKWNSSDLRILDQLKKKIGDAGAEKKQVWQAGKIIFVLGLTFLGSWLAKTVAGFLPEIKDIISAYAWTIIIVSVLGIVLSFTSARKLEDFGTTKIGYFLLYFVLTAIGAKANLSHINTALILIVAGFFVVAFHGAIIFLTARLIKAPMFLAVVASQANIGGVASAPIVAEIYQPGFASVGILLAILGNILGTYIGIITAQLCRMMI